MALQGPASMDDENDSAIGEDVNSDTQSLTDSVTAFPHENGRRYHAFCDGSYLYPNDEAEQERLDLQHEMFGHLLEGQLQLAPLDSPGNVLDLGTGTGGWAINFADQHPESVVLGTDLSPIHPEWVPANCSFEICNYNHPWSFNRQFDFVHARMLATSLTSPDTLFRQVLDNLAPGGWFEIQDVLPPRSDDGTIPATSSYRKWIDDYHRALRAAGRNPHLAEEYEQRLCKTGFVNVKRFSYKLPQNTWPKDESFKLLGNYNYYNTLWGLEGFSLRLFTKYLGQSVPELKELLAGVEDDIRNRAIHAYWPAVVVYAQKPELVDD